MTQSEAIEALRRMIESSGGPDHYIDREEEEAILRKGDQLGIDRPTVEAVLNQMCRAGGWTREGDIIQDLYDQLDEATRDDGVIDQKEFEHCVNYAVSMRMPRKRAMELGVKFIVEHDLGIKKGIFRKDWFTPLRQQYRG